jgi:hypothetical protein
MKKIKDFTYYAFVFRLYDGANQTRILLDLARLKMKNCAPFNMAAYGRKTPIRFFPKGISAKPFGADF